MYPGYGLGCLISEADLLMPEYQMERLSIEKKLLETEEKQESIEKTLAYMSLSAKSRQLSVNPCIFEKIKIKKNLSEISKKIDLMNQNSEAINIREFLPWDENKIVVKSVNRAFSSEIVKHVFFTSIDYIEEDLESFFNNLFSQQYNNSAIIPVGILEGLTNDIKKLVSRKTTVAVVGSFITLNRVRMLDPLVFREGAILSNKLRENASKYYVLTQAILGGVFLGLGKQISVHNHSSEDETLKLMSNLSSISFFCQGAIASFKSQLDQINVWEAYSEWKKKLINDSEAGYPIKFTVRCLPNILEENEKHLNQEEIYQNKKKSISLTGK
jgi:hypothetical protein